VGCAVDGAGAAGPLERVQVELERFIFFPTPDEVAAVGSLVHADDWGASTHRLLVGDARAQLIKAPREWWKTYHASYWRPGFLTATFGPLSARLYHARERLRLRRHGD
jgi:hypothetical protein